jgi:hypothetical protein
MPAPASPPGVVARVPGVLVTMEGVRPLTKYHRPKQPAASLAHAEQSNSAAFYPIPAQYAQGRKAPYHLDLSAILPAEEISDITAAGSLAFHCVGDTGGVKNPAPQEQVAQGLVKSLAGDTGNGTPAGRLMAPSFFYHLGDVVYFNGEVDQYYAQFYSPYEHYPLPILGIPGNHDGDPLNASAISLEGFYRNFLAAPGKPTYTQESQDSGRPAMTQPFFYWTLTTPFAIIIGLYTNVPEHGRLDADQRAWFQAEMKNADPKKALIVALHHPVFSFDTYHSGSPTMAKELEDAINDSGRLPNMVLSTHVHNYQRIEIALGGEVIPFFVIGNGGYYNMHKLSASPGYTDPETAAELVAAIDTQFGFMTFEVSDSVINGHFTTVPNAGGDWSDPNQYDPTFDVFSYTAAPLFLAKGGKVTLVPEDGSNVPPHTDSKAQTMPKRSHTSEAKVKARASHHARTVHRVQQHK